MTGLALLVPASAAAVSRPRATTLKAKAISQSAATLHGKVKPNGAATQYFFQYGPTTLYGSQTTPASASPNHGWVPVSATISGLAPFTRYHFQLVVRHGSGPYVKGADHSFKTKRQPLGVTLEASHNPVRTGASTTLSGTLTGTAHAGREVVLQANPWPYTQGFVNVADWHVTNQQGGFSFPILAVGVNTQYRVQMPQRLSVVSPIVVVGTKVRVTTRLKVRRGRHSGIVHVEGSLIPAVDGTEVIVQKRRGGKWRNIDATIARHHSRRRSHYSDSIRQRRPGSYRVYVQAGGAHVANVGRTIRVRHVRR